jgi:hypothetical protein
MDYIVSTIIYSLAREDYVKALHLRSNAYVEVRSGRLLVPLERAFHAPYSATLSNDLLLHLFQYTP